MKYIISKINDFLTTIGELFNFGISIINSLIYDSIRFKEIADQSWKIFKNTIFITLFAGFVVGMIMALQYSETAKGFDAMGFLGGMATSGTLRELGPLLIAFVLSGKIGSFTTAEIATMKATGQIDAIKSLGLDPIEEIIIPRFAGIIIASFFLLLYGLSISIIGGLFYALVATGLSYEKYILRIPQLVSISSLFITFLKSILFSLIIATVCTFSGYNTKGGARGVGESVVKTAVNSMIGFILFDWFIGFIFTSIINFFGAI